jgi:TetR/AcrR family transcriptional regulator, regulator of cefoperazone and chloramphenicol sensitivity
MTQKSATRAYKTAAEVSDPTRARILDAACEVFAEQGFQAATVRQIVTRAGVNVAAVNYHFGDKLGLYHEVVRRYLCSDERMAARQKLMELKDSREALRAFIRLALEQMAHSIDLRLMAHEMAKPTPALPVTVEEAIRPNYDMLRQLLSRILELPPDHETTRLCAHSVIGQVLHYAHAKPVLQLLWPGMRYTPKQLDQVAEHIATVMLCAMKELRKAKRNG